MTERWPGGPIELPHRFRHGGVDVVLPAVANTVLLDLLAHGRWSHFYPGLIPEGQAWELDVRLADPTDLVFDWHQFFWVARVILGRVAGTMRYRQPPQADDDGYLAARALAARVLLDFSGFASWCARHAFHTPLDDVPMWLLMGAAYGWQQELHATSAELLAELDRALWPPRMLPPPPPEDEDRALSAVPTANGERPRPQIPQHLLDSERDFVMDELRDMGVLD